LAIQAVVKASLYHDSVTLMNIARELRAIQGIEDAALLMGTDANKALLAQADLLAPAADSAAPSDLILVVRGDPAEIERALELAEKLLAQGLVRTAAEVERKAQSVRGAIRAQPSPRITVISVAGQYAADEAWQALEQGSHVLLFSDNVSLEDEMKLKRYAIERGLLLMGPGAGTAILNGVGLGFANAVPRGAVGIISAAGTGLQEVSCLLAQQGSGISQGIGLGGRDLSDDVGGLMMFHALNALQKDPETKVIVAVSKLPSARIANAVERELEAGDKPAVVMFMGSDEAREEKGRLHHAANLHEASMIASALAEGRDPAGAIQELRDMAGALEQKAHKLRAGLGARQVHLRGLFSGGTLCDESLLIWSERVAEVWSNRPRAPEFKLEDVHRSRAHCALDMGEEEFTVGRPHPMIDQDLRLRRLAREAQDPTVAVIQLDVVLGFGAHPDPSAEIGPAISQGIASAKEQGRELLVIASVTGTEADPQQLSRQRTELQEAGAIVLGSNAMAAYLASMIVSDR
jgi:FdrA protein